MRISQLAKANAEAIRAIGARAREEAQMAGTRISYFDGATGEIVIEWPAEGRIERIRPGAPTK